jgi:predicted transposase/invertase (TIGR01784 family)
MFDALVENVLKDKRLARDEGIRVGEKKGRNEGIQVGERKGSRERALETARRMTKDGFTLQQIRKYTEISLKDIRGLAVNRNFV